MRRWSCVDSPLGREPAGGACSAFDPTACRSGLCSDFGSCLKACGHDVDCSADEVCTYEQVRALLLGPTSVISYCDRRSSVEDQNLCCTNSDCAKGSVCAPKQFESRAWMMMCR